jgi:uncharacterized protein YndB with AHSA1/START domain
MSYVNVSTIVKAPRPKIYIALSQPSLYARLMPKELKLKLKSPSMRLNKGAEYEFSVSRFGLDQIWSLRAEEVVPDEKIVFVQSLGIFSKWSHTIQLEDFKEGETIIHHFVEYDLHFGLFGKLYDDLHLRRFITKLLEGTSEKLLKLAS